MREGGIEGSREGGREGGTEREGGRDREGGRVREREGGKGGRRDGGESNEERLIMYVYEELCVCLHSILFQSAQAEAADHSRDYNGGHCTTATSGEAE